MTLVAQDVEKYFSMLGLLDHLEKFIAFGVVGAKDVCDVEIVSLATDADMTHDQVPLYLLSTRVGRAGQQASCPQSWSHGTPRAGHQAAPVHSGPCQALQDGLPGTGSRAERHLACLERCPPAPPFPHTRAATMHQSASPLAPFLRRARCCL